MIVPLSAPAIVTVVVVNAVWVWNELLIALVFLQDDKSRTLTAGLTFFQGRFLSNEPLVMTGALIADHAHARALHRRPALLHPRALGRLRQVSRDELASCWRAPPRAGMLPASLLARLAELEAGCPDIAGAGRSWRRCARAGVAACLGIAAIPRAAGRLAACSASSPGDGYTVENGVYEAVPGLPVPAHVYRPDAPGPAPRRRALARALDGERAARARPAALQRPARAGRDGRALLRPARTGRAPRRLAPARAARAAARRASPRSA